MITLTYDFDRGRAEDLEQINALLATMRLRELELEDHKGYLATTRDAKGNLLRRRYGLSHGKLICRLAEDGDGDIYQIDTVVTDHSVDYDTFLGTWRKEHPDRVQRIVIAVEHRPALAYIIIYHQNGKQKAETLSENNWTSPDDSAGSLAQCEAKPDTPVTPGVPFDGQVLRNLGYTDFEPGWTYILYESTQETGELRPAIIFPHDDRSFEAGHYTCTFVDRDLEFVPAEVYYHPHHFPQNWLRPKLVKNAQKLAARKLQRRAKIMSHYSSKDPLQECD